MFEASSYPRSAVVRRSQAASSLAASDPAALDDYDLQKLWSVIWRGKITILLSIVAALILAALFVFFVPYKYTAVTQILIDPADFHAVANEVTPPNQQSDATVLQVESQVRVLTSDNVLSRVVIAEGLDRDPEFTRGARPSEDATIAALSELKHHVQVKRAERTYVVDVDVTSQDPVKAARIANAIAQAYLAEQTQVRSDSARQISQSLSGRLKELQGRVRDAEQRVEAFKAKNNILGVNGELVNEQQLSSLNAQVSAAHARRSETKARLDQIESVRQSKTPIGAFPEAVQSQTITMLRSQYAEIMRREAEQKTSLGERHPAVIEIEAQAARLQKMIEDEVNRIALSTRADYERATADEETLSRNLDTLKHTAVTTNDSLVGLRELEREAQANRAVYEAFLVRARETSEQEQVDTKNIRVISKADPPQRRSSPPPNLIIGLAAMMLGAASGVGIVLMRGTYQEETSRPDRAAARPNKADAAAKKLKSARAVAPSIPILAMLPQVDISYSLDAVDDPQSHFAQEINKVYEAVRASSDEHDNPSVLVVACDDGDDTASVALTLAAAVAATQRVLLIDADLQRRTLLAIDADRGEAGLVDVAVERRELADVIVRDRQTNVNLVPFVAPNSRRDRQISEADIERAFAKTRRFDMVIVAALDLGRDPTAYFFAGLVDHIVVVARPDEEDKRTVEQFISRLGDDASKFRGVVLTGVEA
jgi:succinoglycan biosynthesis transport protein ExoP